MSASEATARASNRRRSKPRSLRREKSGAAIRLLERSADAHAVVEVTCPKTDNPLYRAFSALRALGVQIVHAEVRAVRDRMVQRLYLMESDGRSLAPNRLTEALVALGRARHLALSETTLRVPSFCA
jgi:UTP:GlnB (protein PII) uridylyltransferase